jgi:hypothetical protein
MSFGRNPRGKIACHQVRPSPVTSGSGAILTGGRRLAALLRHIGQKVGSPCLLSLDHAFTLHACAEDLGGRNKRTWHLNRQDFYFELDWNIDLSRRNIRLDNFHRLHVAYIAIMLHARVKGLILQLTSSCMMQGLSLR